MFRRAINFINPRLLSRELTLFEKATVATGVATSAYTLHQTLAHESKERPVSPLRLFYAKRFHDDEEKRKAGIIPTELFKAAKLALENGKNLTAYKRFDEMSLVHPKNDEIEFYREAADILFKEDQIDKAIKLWELYLNPMELSKRMMQAGDRLFELNKIDKAVTYWEKGADEKDIPILLEKAGDAYFAIKKLQKAAHYWELAEQNGRQSELLFVQLAHYHLKKTIWWQIKGTIAAEEKIQKAINLNPLNATLYNELAVIVFMKAIQTKDDFSKYQLQAIEYFKKAIEIEPNNDIFSKNLDIVRICNNEVRFGSPQQYLQTQVGKPTFMFDAILKELKSHRKETHLSPGMGYGEHDVYNKGERTGTSGGFTLNVTATTVPHVQTESAIHEMQKLQLRWEEERMELEKLEQRRLLSPK